MINKLAVIQQCIFNDLRAIKELETHLEKLYEYREEELKIEGMTLAEWEEALKELKHD